MSDNETQVLLSTPIDQETLNKALAGLAALSTALEKVKKESSDVADSGSQQRGPSFGERIGAGANTAIGKFNALRDKVASVGRDIDEFGGRAFKTLNKLGTGISLAVIGLGAAAARSFATDNAGVDPQANEQNRASGQVKRAFDDLGRVTSRVVTPALEALATAIETIAGVADQIIPKSLEGDNNPFKTFIEKTIPDAIKSVGQLGEIFAALGVAIERDLGNALDNLATGFRTTVLSFREGVAKALNGLLETIALLAESIDPHNLLGGKSLANALRKSEDSDAFAGGLGTPKTNYQRQIEGEASELQQRTNARNTKASIIGGELAAADDQLNNNIQALKGAIKATNDFIEQVPAIGKAEVDAFNARNEAIAKSDEAYQQNRATAQAATNKALERLERDHNNALAELQKAQAEAEKTLSDSYSHDKLKSLQSFNENEAQIEKENQLKREQDLRRHELTLRELAASGDVAGFISEQKQFALGQGDEKGQQDLAKQERRKAFDTENQDRDQQYQTELGQLQKSGQDKIDDLNRQYAQQQADQKEALAEQLAQLKRAHDQERVQIDRDFARELSQLDSNLAGLQNLRNQDYQRQLQSLDNFIKTQQGYLQNLYQTSPGALMNGASGGSSGGDTYHVAVNNTVGDVATQTMLDAYQTTTIDGIAQGLAAAKGRSTPTQVG